MPGGLPWKTLVQVAPQLGQMACQLLLAGLVTGAVAAEAKKHARMISARFGDASLWSIPTTFSQWIPESISDMDVATEVAPTTPPQRARSTLSAAGGFLVARCQQATLDTHAVAGSFKPEHCRFWEAGLATVESLKPRASSNQIRVYSLGFRFQVSGFRFAV